MDKFAMIAHVPPIGAEVHDETVYAAAQNRPLQIRSTKGAIGET